MHRLRAVVFLLGCVLVAGCAWAQWPAPTFSSITVTDGGTIGGAPIAAVPGAGLVQSNGSSLSAATVGTGLTFSGGTLAVSGMCPLGGCTFTGGITAPSLTLSGGGGIAATASSIPITTGGPSGQLTMNGANLVTQWASGPLAVGPSAGAALTSSTSDDEITAGGTFSLQHATAGELSAWGWSTGNACVASCNYDAFFGGSVAWNDPLAFGDTLTGEDSDRDGYGLNMVTGSGFRTAQDGSYFDATFAGALAGMGNSATVTISGTPVVGQAVSVTLTSPDLVTNPTTVSYTIQSSDTTATIAQALATAINATGTLANGSANINPSGIGGNPSWTNSVISFTWPGTETVGWSVVVTTNAGASGLTLAVANGSTGNLNTGTGYGTLDDAFASSANNNTGDGTLVMPFLTTGSNNYGGGGQTLFNNQTGNLNTSVGPLSSYFNVSGSGNDVSGAYANYNNNGSSDVIMDAGIGGPGAADPATNVNFSILIGDDLWFQNPAAGGQLTIGNLILGGGLGTNERTIDTSGFVSIAAPTNSAYTLTVGSNTSGSLLLTGAETFASSTTGAGSQTFTNSPCTGLTTEQWIPVGITGKTGTYYVAACQ